MTGKYSLVLVLLPSGCGKPEPAGQNSAELAQYLQHITGGPVFIPGSMFWTGDLCSRTHGEGVRCPSEKDAEPLYEVTLSSCPINRFKVTREGYAFYLKMAGLPELHYKDQYDGKTLTGTDHSKNGPTVVSWREADSYCRWLREETGLPFSLPMEVQ